MKLTDTAVALRQIDTIVGRLKEGNLSPETIRHLNQQMRYYKGVIEESKASPKPLSKKRGT